jgi:hypothetical protein
MPHYYFDIKDGHTLVDPSGLNFKTDDDAIARAQEPSAGQATMPPDRLCRWSRRCAAKTEF